MDQIKQLSSKYSIARYELIRECDGDEIRFYLYLKLYAINKHEAFPSYTTIQKDLGWSRMRISRLIKKMVREDRLKVGKVMRRKTIMNIYDITWYDRINNSGRGSNKTILGSNKSLLPFLEQPSNKTVLEPLVTINNRTSRETDSISPDEQERTLGKLKEMKQSLINKKIMVDQKRRTEIQEEVGAMIRPSGK